MAAVAQAYSAAVHYTIDLPQYSVFDYDLVAPDADWQEAQFLASRALYSAQTDETFVLESSDVEETYNTAVLNQWALESAFHERDAILIQLASLEEYFEDIDREAVEKATVFVAYSLAADLKPQSLGSYLTYNQSLNIRADLAHGTVHLSVIFEPGIDPTDPTPDEDGDDANASISFYDKQGVLRAGSSGPLPQILLKLDSLAQMPVALA